MLDDVMPRFDFREQHRRAVAAPAADTWAALTRTTLRDLTITRPLVALRHLGGSRPEADVPRLTGGPLTLLHRDDVATRAVGGAVARPWQPSAPRRPVGSLAELAAFGDAGWTKYVTEFRVVPDGAGCVIVTETRGISTDAAARRRFRAYWTLIRVPSGLVRRDVLRTAARLATRDAAGTAARATAQV